MLTSEYIESLIEVSRYRQEGLFFFMFPNSELVVELTDALEALLNG